MFNGLHDKHNHRKDFAVVPLRFGFGFGASLFHQFIDPDLPVDTFRSRDHPHTARTKAVRQFQSAPPIENRKPPSSGTWMTSAIVTKGPRP